MTRGRSGRLVRPELLTAGRLNSQKAPVLLLASIARSDRSELVAVVQAAALLRCMPAAHHHRSGPFDGDNSIHGPPSCSRSDRATISTHGIWAAGIGGKARPSGVPADVCVYKRGNNTASLPNPSSFNRGHDSRSAAFCWGVRSTVSEPSAAAIGGRQHSPSRLSNPLQCQWKRLIRSAIARSR